jgi:hypothetical protein
MTVRFGANGMPIIKKDTIQEITKVEKIRPKKKSTDMIQEILEENPNALCEVCNEDPCVCDQGETNEEI